MDKTVIAIPSAIDMVTITGPGDSFVTEFERAFPELDYIKRATVISESDKAEATDGK